MTVDTSLRPGPRGQEIIARDDQVMSGSLMPRYPFVMDHGLGARVWDVDGNEYIDFAAGIAVTATGHCHPKVVAAVTEQAQKFLHIAGTDYYYDVQVRLAERLAQIAPFDGPSRVFLCNSGAEAVEGAVKLARWYTGRQNVIAFYGSFHGRTMGALSLTASKVVQRSGFGAMIPGVFHAPYNNPYRNSGYEDSFITDVLFQKTLDPESVAAIILEPMQGEGGYILPESRWVQKLRDICDQYNILLIADEVQTGIGRTGRWWAMEHHGVQPDIVCSAKGLGSGMPIGAFISKAHIMTWPPGAHGSTFGGNPVSCAAALATLDLVEESYMANAAEQGAYLMDALQEMQPRHPSLRHGRIQGLGLMIGAELVLDEQRTPAHDLRDRVERIAIDNGLLVLGAGTSTVRFCPPLMIDTPTVDEGLRRFEDSLTQAEQEAGML